MTFYKEWIIMGEGDRFKFKGRGISLFFIYLKNILLTAITLGIYSFWARVNIKRFVYNSTFYQNEPFEYYGTGKEKFIGFLKSIVLIIFFVLSIGIINLVLSKMVGSTLAAIIGGTIAYMVIIAVIPFIIIGSQRYRLSRSSYRNVRFGFYGKARELVVLGLRGIFFCIITLGIYYPWFMLDLKNFMICNSYYGTQPFTFSADERKKFAVMVIRGFLISIITLGIYSFWLSAAIERFTWDHTGIQDKKFSCSLTGGNLLTTTIIAFFQTVFTLGLGAPWAIVRISRVRIESITLEKGIDFAVIKTDFDEKASALADGLSDSADIFETLVSFIS